MFRTKRRLNLQTFAPVPEGYLVGGAVRDALLGRDVSDLDWLVAEPQALARAVADELGGTVFPLDEERGFWRVVTQGMTRDYLRLDGELEHNLSERDFTINAMASKVDGTIIDPFGGIKDLKAKIVRMLSIENLQSDPLRVLRAVRFATVLGFKIEVNTFSACQQVIQRQHMGQIPWPAWERVTEELDKIICSNHPVYGFQLLSDLKALDLYLPEIVNMQGVEQGGFHHLNVLEHSLEALHQLVQRFPESDASLRWATLLHDIAKPLTKTFDDSARYYHFYGHDKLGAEIATKILERLRYATQIQKKSSTLIAWHMLPLPKTDKEARRFVHKRKEVLPDLLKLMIADREAARGKLSSAKNREAYRLALARVLAILSEPAPAEPLMTGREVMDILGISQGPRIGQAMRFISEAQAVGDATTKEEAIDLLKTYALRQGWIN